jgi:lipoprotein-releasing system permease protein
MKSKKDRFTLFVALRFFSPKRRDKNRAGNRIAVIGIATGVMSLIATLAVMNGLQQGYISSILELGSAHALIRSRGFLSEEQLDKIRSLKMVRAVAAEGEVQTLARSDYSSYNMITIKGLDIKEVSRDNLFFKHLNITSGIFPDTRGTILLGSELAKYLGVAIGDKVYALTMTGSRQEAYEEPLTVCGIYKSGYYAYDSSLAFVSLDEALHSFVNEKEIYYKVKIYNPYHDKALITELTRQGLTADSWRNYNRAFFGALRMEKNIMILLLSLIFVVVAVNIFQSRRREIEERSEEIAFLRALGARPDQIEAIFSLQGLFIGITGAVTGLTLGLLVSKNINTIFHFIEYAANTVLHITGSRVTVALLSGDGYYLHGIPTRLVLSDIIFTLSAAIISSFIAAFTAAAKITGIRPWEALRNS